MITFYSDPTPLLDLAFRWVHVIAGIMWIGNSLLFNWLDRNLRPAARGAPELYGDIWLLHSGAFYFVEKTSLAGQPMPKPLHWFKWQAYTTWLSGTALLIVVYYLGARSLLVDPSRAALSPAAAVGVAAGSIVVGWLVYDVLWRFVAPRSALTAGVLSIAALIAIVYGLTGLLSGRAAFLHVGGLLATIMAGNVAMTIMPSQRVLVDAVTAGRAPDPAVAARAKTRSIHNNYLTFPVIVLMLSNHFPGVYGHSLSWVLLLVLIAIGATVRHLLNIRYTFARWVPALGLTIAAGFLVLLIVGRPRSGGSAAVNASVGELPARVSFEEARSIIDRRCAACHSANPAITEFGSAPGGVSFDDPARIQALADRIRFRAVETKTMPLGNRTNITERERAILGRWIQQR
ncbi:MAG TPA: urate hydroxylase PuuD [Gemmatimonadaceae bacterium]|nr:urate hydroxylase PuuD [Gemmatimonadaceae bacterium]